jgi:two-component system cell cycle response regulator
MNDERTVRILIAEDHPSLRKQLEFTLSKAGFDTTSVENGRQAIELFSRNFFPILLTDWMMPEMNGLELCHTIRITPMPGYVYIILLMAKSLKEDTISGLEAGADDFLRKPFDMEELIARIKTGTRILNLENSLKKANKEIRLLSITDPLTKCYNRGYLVNKLQNEIKRARRNKRPLSIALCNIDHFKKINDTYGNQVGDRMLNIFVEYLKNSIRAGMDWIVRYGGDEFLIVFPETGIAEARDTASRLKCDLTRNVITFEEHTIQITASFGRTGFDRITPEKYISPDMLIRAADECLYQSKMEGRNRVKAKELWRESLRLTHKTL